MKMVRLLGKTVQAAKLHSRPSLCRQFTGLGVGQYPPDFSFWPDYFTGREQRVLLKASLQKLDASETRISRRRRKEYWKSRAHELPSSQLIEFFAPDELYDFQEASVHRYLCLYLFLTILYIYRDTTTV